MKWLLVGVLLLAAQAVSAQPCDPQSNGIGIYFDQQGCDYCAMPAPYTTVTGYVLATNVDPSLGGISGFEFKLLCDPLPPALLVTVPGYVILDDTFPFYRVPLCAESAPAIKLATISMLWIGITPIRFGLGPHVPSSGDGTSPMIAAGNDPTLFVPLRYFSQNVPWPGENYGYTVAWVGNCPVAVADASWGGIKSLFR